MQDRIRSKYDDWELLGLSAENQVWKTTAVSEIGWQNPGVFYYRRRRR